VSTTRITRHLNAPPERVYRALIDPQAIAEWRVPNGMKCHVHEHDAREGGTFRVSLTYDAPNAAGKSSAHTDTYHGRFVKLVPGIELVEAMEFETSEPSLQGEMTVRYSLSETDGGTDLFATHEGVPPGVPPADNETGWRMALDKLAALVEK